jgi:TP901 family phage tail tape measure protein
MSGNLVEILITGKNMSKAAFEGARADAGGLKAALGGMATVGVAGLAAVGVESVKMAANYQRATVQLVTSAGEQNKNLGMVREGMLNMAGSVGVSAQDLAKAMYYVEAAGFHAGDGLTVLKAAAQGAAAEGANTTTVAQALTDVLVDYHLKASSAADITSKMITAVAHGKTNLQDFAGAFASIVPAASAAGISFDDVGAALSNMTNHGFTANRASQNLAQALRSLLNPTKTMQKAFDEYGVSGEELKAKLHGPNGLTDAMEYLSQAASKAGKEGTPEFAAALKLLMGTAPGANAALATVGQNFQSTADTITAMGKATADAKGQVQGFAEVKTTLSFQWKQIEAGFDSLLIKLGTGMLPVLSKMITQVEQFAGPIQKAFSSAFSGIASGFSGLAGKAPAAPHLTGKAARMAEMDGGGELPAPKLTQWQKVGQMLHGIVTDFQTFGRDVAKSIENITKAAQPVAAVLGGAFLVALQAVGGILAHVVGPALKDFTDFLAHNQGLVKTFAEVALGGLAVKMTAIGGIRAATGITELAGKILGFPMASVGAIGKELDKLKDAARGVRDAAGGIKDAFGKIPWSSIASGARATWGGLRFGAVTAAQGIKDAFSGLGTKIGDGLVGAAGKAGTAWGTIQRGARGAMDTITEFGGTAKKAIGDALETAAGHAGTAWGTIQRGALSAAEGAKALWGGLRFGAVGAVQAIKDGATALGELAVKAGLAAMAGLRAAAAWTAEKAALLAQAVAEKAAAAGQWLLDAAMDANPIGLIVLAIAAVVVAFVELWKHSAAFRDFWKGLWKDVTAIISAVVDWIKQHWPLLLAILTGPIGIAVLLIVKNWRSISDGAQAVWRDVVHFFTSMAAWLAGLPKTIYRFLSGMFDFIGNEAAGIYNTVIGWLQSIVNFAASIPSKIMGGLGSLGGKVLSFMGFAHGGEVSAAAVGGPRGGMVMVGEQGPELVRLPFGSTVHSNPDTQRMLAGGGGGYSGQPIQVNFILDGRAQAKALIDPLRGEIRVLGGNVQTALGVNH